MGTLCYTRALARPGNAVRCDVQCAHEHKALKGRENLGDCPSNRGTVEGTPARGVGLCRWHSWLPVPRCTTVSTNTGTASCFWLYMCSWSQASLCGSIVCMRIGYV